MIFTVDRVQYSKTQDKFFMFELLEVPNIEALRNSDGTVIYQDTIWFGGFWISLYEMVSNIDKKKLEFLQNWETDATRIFIIYQSGINAFIKVEIAKGHYECGIGTFNDLQQWFRSINNIDGNSFSKGLGAAREANEDEYVNSLLCSLYNDSRFRDDNGLELTKHLLAGDSTKGIDLDLFQRIPSTNEFIIYEFLKRENPYIGNIQAHPMRYCWTGFNRDNKQKYISLWRAKKFLNAKLLLINYSDNPDEDVSIIEVLDLNEQSGFLEENQYCMSRSGFLDWLRHMENYEEHHNEYFSNYLCVHHDKEFFQKFSQNKKQYGSEFKS